jgi:hypothetical protein
MPFSYGPPKFGRPMALHGEDADGVSGEDAQARKGPAENLQNGIGLCVSYE